ncbi:MAG: hypothetical protein GXX79_02860 [Actinomycetales bacterium]|nr:hypothetical protein [Actinomycetales bacterium]
MDPVWHDDVERELGRVADRLRVIGPRMEGRGTGPHGAGDPGREAGAVLESARAAVQRLADLAADTEGLPRRTVERLPGHALADQVLVLGHDLLAAAPADERGREPLEAGHALLVDLRRSL